MLVLQSFPFRFLKVFLERWTYFMLLLDKNPMIQIVMIAAYDSPFDYFEVTIHPRKW